MPYSFNIASGIVGMKIAEYAALDTAYELPMYNIYCLLATRYAGILNILYADTEYIDAYTYLLEYRLVGMLEF